MPVRSSVCTYSPASANSTSSKYSSSLTPSSLSIGHYKPIGTSTSIGNSVTSNYKPKSSSFRSSPSFGRFSGTTGANNYSVSGSNSSRPYSLGGLTTSAGSGQYKPLSCSVSARYGNSSAISSSSTLPSSSRFSTSSLASNNSLTSTSSSASSSITSSASPSYHHHTNNHNHHHHLPSSSSNTSAYESSSPVSSYYSSYSPSTRRTSHLSHYHSPYSTTTSTSVAQEPLPSDVPKGLINLGNTCYMNASLQSLYSIESFRSLILRATHDKVLTSELSDLFKSMKNSSSPISPSSFKYAFSRYQSKFSGTGQQDAQEFLRYLINGIHEELNQVSRRQRRRSIQSQAPKTPNEAWSQYREIVDDSPLVDLVVGQLCSTIVCGQCHSKSHCWDPFWDLSLPLIRGKYSLKLSDALDDFTAKETLDSDERPICSQCKKATRSTKQISLSRLPQVLILHLKKFTNDGYKLTSPDIEIDKHLAFNNSTTTYTLKACISHHGHSSSSGHYTAHCEYSNRWYHFNDDRVRDVTNSFDCSKLDDAYVLFYTQASSSSCNRSALSQQSKL